MDGNPDDPTALAFASIDLQKSAGSFVPATSGTAGNFDVTYTFVFTNTGTETLDNVAITDNLAAQFGDAFERVVPNTVTVSNSTATTTPGANTNFAGGANQSLVDNTGVVASGQSFTVTVVVELDPDADPSVLVNGQFENTAFATGENPADMVVMDESDDPTDPTSDLDDPTLYALSDITALKSVSGFVDATSGTAGNFDVSYTFTVTNTCLLYTSPSPRDLSTSRMPSSA